MRYIEREFPLNNPALAGSVIARCIDPSRFYAFNDLLFSKQEDWAFKDDALKPLRLYAKQAGLTDADFEKCIDDESLQRRFSPCVNAVKKRACMERLRFHQRQDLQWSADAAGVGRSHEALFEHAVEIRKGGSAALPPPRFSAAAFVFDRDENRKGHFLYV